MTALPEELVEAFLRLCQGDFTYRLPRTPTRDSADTNAVFFNSIAAELERILGESREQEQRLADAVERFSVALTRLAAGDFEVELPRDFRGDGVDVLASLVNNVAAELRQLVADKERASQEREGELARLVEERTTRMRASEESFRKLFEAAPVPMVLLDAAACTVLFANERAATVLRVDPRDLLGTPAARFFEDEDQRNELQGLLSRDGALDAVTSLLVPEAGPPFWCLVSARPVSVGGAPTLLASFQDISEQKLVEERLRDLATKDPLTNVLNRRRFFEIAEEEFARVDRYGGEVAVALLDLDHFKNVNDRFGHTVGDEALRRVAGTLAAALRRQDHIARYGGEEFVALLPQTSLEGASVIAERMRTAVGELHLTDEGTAIPLTISIGVASRSRGEALLPALERADQALYRAKDEGRDRVALA